MCGSREIKNDFESVIFNGFVLFSVGMHELIESGNIDYRTLCVVPVVFRQLR